MRASAAVRPLGNGLPRGGASGPDSAGVPRTTLSPEALRAALMDLAEFGVIYLDAAADAEAVARSAPVPARAWCGGDRWRVEVLPRREA